MEPVTRKRYTAEFKAQAVELVGLGKPVPQVADDLEIGTGVLNRWMRRGGQGVSSIGRKGACEAENRFLTVWRHRKAGVVSRIGLAKPLVGQKIAENHPNPP